MRFEIQSGRDENKDKNKNKNKRERGREREEEEEQIPKRIKERKRFVYYFSCIYRPYGAFACKRRKESTCPDEAKLLQKGPLAALAVTF